MFYTTSFLNAPKNIIAVVVKVMILFTSSCLSKWLVPKCYLSYSKSRHMFCFLPKNNQNLRFYIL